jgi:hypothetical protein
MNVWRPAKAVEFLQGCPQFRGKWGMAAGPFAMAVSSTLGQLYSVFGNAVLIPVRFKSKVPVDAGWNAVTFADTQEAAYQGRLATAAFKGGNIGIVLGPASGNIVSIDIDRDLDQFLQLNPRLGDTTRTQGRPGRAQFFINARIPIRRPSTS